MNKRIVVEALLRQLNIVSAKKNFESIDLVSDKLSRAYLNGVSIVESKKIVSKLKPVKSVDKDAIRALKLLDSHKQL